MSLNVMCGICNEFYKSTDSVYSTSVCGHLFHHECLFRWLNRSNTCPQCRQSCHRRRVHKVYLNFGERTELNEDETIPSIYLHWTLVEDLKQVPKNGIKCGTDTEGNDAYVARVYYNEDLLPANFVPNKGAAFTPWNCQARRVTEEIEILIDCDYNWVAATDGNVPENAIVTGYTETGEDLYTGRAVYEGRMLAGKVHPSHGVLYMPFNELEVNAKEYEVLVRSTPPTDSTGQPT